MSETSTSTGEVSDAIQAYRRGQTSLARDILTAVHHSDPENEYALLWLAVVVESQDDAMHLIERVASINPNNELAVKAISVDRLIQGRRPAASKPKLPTEPAPAKSPKQPEKSPCFVCGSERAPASICCPECGAPYSLKDLSTVLNHSTPNERRLEQEIRRWQAKLEKEVTAEALLALGTAYLTLHRSGDALPYLRRALGIRPSDSALRAACQDLALRPLILVVDDSSTVRRVVSITLERHGHRVRTAIHGREGLARFEEEKPNLVLLDITMPEMDGYELCKNLRRTSDIKALPILMLSGNDGIFDKVRGKMAGASDYITKPFQQEALVATINRFLPAAEHARK